MGKEATNAPAYSDLGSIEYEDLAAAPRIHRVFNVDTNWYHVMDIELLNLDNVSKVKPLKGPTVEMVFDEKHARGYRLTLSKSSLFELEHTEAPYIFISQSTAPINYTLDKKDYYRKMQPAHFLYVHEGSDFSIKPAEDVQFVVLEIK